MSILGSTAMGSPFFQEFKKQASFFLKEKIKTARLALTDVTPAELLVEEVTNGNSWAPDARTMSFVSRSAFEIDDYWRIVKILHNRLSKFDRKQWREPYHALMLLEHLLTHGPESVAGEFHSDQKVIEEMGTFQYIDERGFNWGLALRKKSERVQKLLEKGPLLKEERDRARKISRGIKGFGSFNHRWSTTSRSGVEQASHDYGRSYSHYEDFSGQDEIDKDDKEKDLKPLAEFDAQITKKSEAEKSQKEITAEKSSTELEVSIAVDQSFIPKKELLVEESRSLLGNEKEKPKMEFQDHPFHNFEHQSMESMLLLRQ